MTKKHEEFVEKIVEELADYYVDENGIGLAFVIPHGQHWPLLRRIITLALSAVGDGLKIPGWQTIFHSICCWQEDKDGTQILTSNAPDNGEYWLLRADDRGAIALRKEEEQCANHCSCK